MVAIKLTAFYLWFCLVLTTICTISCVCSCQVTKNCKRHCKRWERHQQQRAQGWFLGTLAFVEHEKDKANELTEVNKVFNTNTKMCLQKLIWSLISPLFRFNTGNRACLKEFKRARDFNSVLLNEKNRFGIFF